MKILFKWHLIVPRVRRTLPFVGSKGCSLLICLLLLPLIGCEGSDDEAQETSPSTTPTGVAVSLRWAPVKDSSVVGYYIHYGKRSPNQPGSCAYDDELFVTSDHGTVINLDPGLTYYFAVSAYNGLDSSCSNEVFTQTPQVDCCPS